MKISMQDEYLRAVSFLVTGIFGCGKSLFLANSMKSTNSYRHLNVLPGFIKSTKNYMKNGTYCLDLQSAPKTTKRTNSRQNLTAKVLWFARHGFVR